MVDLSEEDLNNPNLQGIEVGLMAPEFTAVNATGETNEKFTLSEEVKKHRGTLMIFFRFQA